MTNREIVLIDYGVGNLLSVQRGLEYCGANVVISRDPKRILNSYKVVLPGVGAFDNAMSSLHSLRLVDVFLELHQREIPILGICLGMQLLFEQSYEFKLTRGLGLIPGDVVEIPKYDVLGHPLKVPHIGWSALEISNSFKTWNGTLLQDNKSGDAVYFVHSYMASPKENHHRIADCQYGGHRIAAVVGYEHITGCQFHPEKSGELGLKILQRFCVD